METIFINLLDPAWWFTAFFPAIAFILAPRAWRASVNGFRRYVRGSRARSLRHIRMSRRDDLLIARQMLSAQAAFFMFMMLVAVGLILLVLSPFTNQPSVSRVFVFFLSLPILVSELVWLLRDGRVGDLLKYRDRSRRARALRSAGNV